MDTYKGYDSEFDCPAIYEVIVHGIIEPDHLCGLEEMTISYQTQEDGNINTVFTGLLVDQAALNGVLNVIRLYQLTIVSVLKVGDCI